MTEMAYSVAMCTYNGEKYIRQQLDSILGQTIKPDEIIVCDDGSTDETRNILDEYQQKHPNIFKVYHNEVNLRSVKNFEKAISLCTQDIIFLSDQDDLWVENKAEIMLKYFEDNPNINALATNGYCLDENGKIHDKYSVWDVPRFLRELGLPVNYYEMITYVSNIATGASMAFRARIKPNIIPFPVIKGYHHDEWIATITSQNGNFELLDEKLFYYRIHAEQQVGGVFFDKTEKQKKGFTHIFNLHLEENNFRSYKKILKLLSTSYQKNILLEQDSPHFIKRSELLREKFFTIKQKCIQHFPIRSRILFFIDKLTGKRQMKM